MIQAPTAHWTHGLFEALGWGLGAGLGFTVARWRLREAAVELAGRTGPGYFMPLRWGPHPALG
jgi:hypothetical protein